jgi:hypothetical protein
MFAQSSNTSWRWHRKAALALLAASSLALVACGGGGGSSSSLTGDGSTSQPPPAVRTVTTDNETSIIITNATSATSTTATTSTTPGTSTTSTTATTPTTPGTGTGTEVITSKSLDFEGKVTEGPSLGTELKGKLMLNAKSTDGGKNFTVTGKLLTRSEPKDDGKLTDAQKEKIKEALKKYDDQVRVLLETYRRDLGDLAEVAEKLLKVQRDAFKDIDPLSTGAKEKYKLIEAAVKATLDELKKKLDSLNSKLEDNLKAKTDELQAALKGVTNSGDAQSIAVTGTLTGTGAIKLTFDLGNGAKIEGMGQSDKDGQFSGTFTGPQAGDKGTWKAESCLKSPLPSTPPSVTSTTSTTPGTSTTPTTSTTPGTSTTSTTPTLPPVTDQACPLETKTHLYSLVSQITAPTAFRVTVGISVGAYVDSIPIDASSAKFVNGTSADLKVGEQVRVCSDDVIPLVGGNPNTPLKATHVILLKAK